MPSVVRYPCPRCGHPGPFRLVVHVELPTLGDDPARGIPDGLECPRCGHVFPPPAAMDRPYLEE